MPRGVAIPDIKELLFRAAEDLVTSQGLTAITSRSITARAGVATGLLFRHFAQLDDFFAGYLIDRVFQMSEHLASLPERSITASHADHLSHVVLGPTWPMLQASARLLAAHPHLSSRVRDILGEQGTIFDILESGFAGYLHDEQRQARLSDHADSDMLALTLTAATHHLILTSPSTAPTRVPDVFTAILTSTASADVQRVSFSETRPTESP